MLPHRPHCPTLLHRWPGHSSTHPHLMLFSGDGSQTSQLSYSPPRRQPLPCLRRLPVVPFVGLAVVHHPGALGAAWSMWSTTDFHQKSNVHGEADSWVHDSCKEVPPYYTKIIIPPSDSGDPPNGPPVFCEKNRFPLTAGTHRTGHRISRKNVPPAVSSDPPEVPPYYAQKNEYSPG